MASLPAAQIGKCNSECRTIAKACDVISEELDLTDLSAMVIKGRKRAELKQWMCYDSSEACLSKAPLVPAVRSCGEVNHDHAHGATAAVPARMYIWATQRVRVRVRAGVGGGVSSQQVERYDPA